MRAVRPSALPPRRRRADTFTRSDDRVVWTVVKLVLATVRMLGNHEDSLRAHPPHLQPGVAGAGRMQRKGKGILRQATRANHDAVPWLHGPRVRIR